MSHFFAHLARMKLISRWPLMRNTQPENVQEHSLQVAMVAHALVLLKNQLEGTNLSPDKAATMALFHDASETLTGDLPTPVKYFNPQIEQEYKKIEQMAEQKLLDMVPPELQDAYRPLLLSSDLDQEYKPLVKAADVLCAYIKCLEELTAGNHEFFKARGRLLERLESLNMPEVDKFCELFVPSFELTLDEISQTL